MIRVLKSLTFRLALFYLALFTVSVAGLLALAWWVAVQIPLQDVSRGLSSEAEQLAGFYALDDPQPLIDRLVLRGDTPGERHPVHALVGPDGRTLVANIPRWPGRRGDPWLNFELDEYESFDGEEREVLAYDIDLPDGGRLLIGRDVEDLDDREDLITNALGWGAAAIFAFGLLGGILMSLIVARRIDAVRRTARQVMAGDLSGRVKVHGTNDDFDRLGETLNDMLARIEQLVQSVGRVSDSIAHELRTPLTRLRADIEDLAHEIDETRPEALRLVDQALFEVERLQATFDALLRIARIETGRHTRTAEPMNVAEILEDAADLYGPAAEERAQAIGLSVEPNLTIVGDPNLMFQAVSNLIDNAIKYGPEAGAILLSGRRRGDAVEIVVEDRGPGIDEAHRAHVVERFYRAPGHNAVDGLGLGLSLVAAVAHQHGAELVFEDAGPGLRATLRVPVPGPR
ncbi:sensor histidine kinase [Acuticoccus kandeliae]|uniref:sensor histidine kinase n=1 Tax=Acuticoccus kandeliae TaxID=2073160 RepID=UPI001300933E|nr:HAMP domain-containing sensor histidine kinase [Acuticoccus kandeliae]